MKAAVWKGHHNFTIEDVEQPVPGDEQLIVQVKAASICTTDLHYENFGCKPPIIPGHEASGIVVKTGKIVHTHCVGDRVTLDPVQRCGLCDCCKGGISHLCLNVRHLGNSENPGSWAEFVAIDAVNAYKIPENLSFETAALTEPAAVCLESFKRAGFQKGWNVLIMGDGTFGFIHAMLANILGAKTIIVVGHYDERLERIKQATGAIICNSHNKNVGEFINEYLDGTGIDLAIEATGADKVPNIAINTLRPRGVLILFSYVWNPEITDLGLIHMKELSILGACRSLECFDKCIELMTRGKLNLSCLIDILVPLESVSEAVEKLKKEKKNTFKAVLLP